jgi:hypothetical protein
MKSINEIINDALSEIRKVYGIEVYSISSTVEIDFFNGEDVQRRIEFQGEAKVMSYSLSEKGE